MPLNFVLADVFTRSPFAGNQLAVCLDGSGLTDRQMQLLAREFKFPETTFVLPAHAPDADVRVRIFTPSSEVAFAGHPTLGTAAALAAHGSPWLRERGPVLRLEEEVGVLPVEVSPDGDAQLATLRYVGGAEFCDSTVPPADMGRVLQISAASVLEIAFASVGLPFCFVRLGDARQVDAVCLDLTSWRTTLTNAWSRNLFIWAELQDGSVHARMFAPALGIPEDPATGSAALALAALRASRLQGSDEARSHLRIRQGVAMGRPSVIEAEATMRADARFDLRLSGHVVLVGNAELAVPD